jgi:hypothetical protein
MSFFQHSSAGKQNPPIGVELEVPVGLDWEPMLVRIKTEVYHRTIEYIPSAINMEGPQLKSEAVFV